MTIQYDEDYMVWFLLIEMQVGGWGRYSCQLSHCKNEEKDANLGQKERRL